MCFILFLFLYVLLVVQKNIDGLDWNCFLGDNMETFPLKKVDIITIGLKCRK